MQVNSTLDAIETFMNSVLWDDFRNELNIWKEAFEQERAGLVDTVAESNPSTASVLVHLGDLHGRIKAVDYLLELPSIFQQLKQSETEDAEKSV